MYKIQAVVLAVTTVFGSIHCAVFPAGKCNTKHIEPVEIDFHKMAGYGKLYIPYGPQINVTKKVDHTDLVFTRISDDSYTVVNTRYFKDKTIDKQSNTYSIVDGVILSNGVDGGKPYHFHLYPIAKSNEDGILFYRCADYGLVAPVDTRFMAVPVGRTLSEESLKQLFEADNKYNFRGDFYKFPNRLS